MCAKPLPTHTIAWGSHLTLRCFVMALCRSPCIVLSRHVALIRSGQLFGPSEICNHLCEKVLEVVQVRFFASLAMSVLSSISRSSPPSTFTVPLYWSNPRQASAVQEALVLQATGKLGTQPEPDADGGPRPQKRKGGVMLFYAADASYAAWFKQSWRARASSLLAGISISGPECTGTGCHRRRKLNGGCDTKVCGWVRLICVRRPARLWLQLATWGPE
jgi:hypothetical protein